MPVEYREIDFTVGYRIGSDGTVWSRRNARWGLRDEWRELRNSKDLLGYPTVHLMMPNKRAKTFRVHALVLLAFVGPRPKGADSCHNNGNPSDCSVENLRWGTRRENVQDAIAHGRMKVGSLSNFAKLNERQVSEIRASREQRCVLASRYSVSGDAIYAIRTRLTWKHLP